MSTGTFNLRIRPLSTCFPCFFPAAWHARELPTGRHYTLAAPRHKWMCARGCNCSCSWPCSCPPGPGWGLGVALPLRSSHSNLRVAGQVALPSPPSPPGVLLLLSLGPRQMPRRIVPPPPPRIEVVHRDVARCSPTSPTVPHRSAVGASASTSNIRSAVTGTR
jgi:hypothetical protein